MMGAPRLDWLQDIAARLSDGQIRVHVRPLLARYGIELEKVVQGQSGAAGRRGEVRRRADGRYQIVLYRSDTRPRPLSASERFTVGHELGHILVDVRTNWKPISRSEFYRLEEACDRFAATLMIPTGVLECFDTLESSSSALEHLLEVSRLCRVPKAKTAGRLADWWGNVVLFRTNWNQNAAGERVAVVRWSAGGGQEREFGITQGKHFTTDTTLGRALLKGERQPYLDSVYVGRAGRSTKEAALSTKKLGSGVVGSLLWEEDCPSSIAT